jgi:hypothetical protein
MLHVDRGFGKIVSFPDTKTSKTQEYYLPNFGWHFSSVGGVDRIFRKLESFAHQEFNNNPHKAEVAERVAKKGNNCTLEGLPEYLLINKEKFSYLFDQGV